MKKFHINIDMRGEDGRMLFLEVEAHGIAVHSPGVLLLNAEGRSVATITIKHGVNSVKEVS